MPNKRVMVARTGSPLFLGGQSSARGELDTLPVIQHLLGRGDLDVCYFGSLAHRESVPKNLRIIDTRMQDLPGGNYKYMLPADEVAEHLDVYVRALGEFDPEVTLVIEGATATWSWIDNPSFAFCQQFSVLYSLPVLYAIHALGLRRYSIVTDPKCYTRDSEMTTCWPECVPRACLSQETRTFPKRVQGVKLSCHAVYAACEYWLTDGMRRYLPTAAKTVKCRVAANAHLNEARLPKGRTDLWSEIFSTLPDDFEVCGAGWEKHPWWGDPRLVGRLPSFGDVMQFLAGAEWGVMIPQSPGFATTKVRLYALAGCAPRPWSRGAMTYDRDARVLPLDHPARWPGPPLSDPRAVIEEVLERTRPDFSLLDRLIDEPRCRWPEDDWLSTYGGYAHA